MATRIILLFIILITLGSCNSGKHIINGLRTKDFVQLKANDSIYYSKFEVTNQEYRNFMYHLRKVSSDLYSECIVKPENWYRDSIISIISISEIFANNYAFHPAYNDFPVVNISFEGANQYCNWLNSQLKKDSEIYFRLPSVDEFYNLLNSINMSLEGDNYEDYEEFNFNLRFIENLTADGALYPIQTKPSEPRIKNYKQSEKGIYHVIGNVNELLLSKEYIGGSWLNYPSEAKQLKNFQKPDPRVGFRILLVRKKGN